LCNDNLSGVVAAAALAEMLTGFELEHSYRFLFIPETIGSITWLWLNRDRAADIKCGLVLTCLGDAGGATYQKTWQGGRDLDRAALLALRDAGGPFAVRDFRPAGSDERQFSSPGFRIPMGVLMRSPYLEFAQYHTSADDLSFVSPEKLADSLGICLAIIYILEHNAFYQSLNPHCEPQLSRRGLYRSLGRGEMESEALFWLLNYCDGDHDLADIARRSGLGFREIKQGADLLRDHGLLELKQTADPGSGNSRRLENDHEDHNPGR
jgi:aminopeptidase-like protein